ncbi:MAG: hypothetical protein MI725_09580 [Pirellulales bacterium]|nr:hypothetical protein [Pirellulales bacterium]
MNWIANGKRFDHATHKRQKRAAEPQAVSQAVRCRGCGARIVVLPCQLCQLRRLVKKHEAPRRLHNPATNPFDFGINLEGTHLERYLAVRAAKIRRGEKPHFRLLPQLLRNGETTMPLLGNMKYVRWFLSHVDELGPLLDLPEQLRNAASLAEKWKLLKSAGDQLVGLIESFPVEDVPQALSEQVLQKEATTQGIPWDQLMELLPTIIRIIELIRGEEA